MPLHQRMLQFGAAVAVLSVVAPGTSSLAAQSAATTASSAAGRWAVTLTGGVPPRVRGELRLTADGARLAGMLVLETHDSAAVPLRALRLDADGRIVFDAEAGTAEHFSGVLEADSIVGEASGGPNGPWRWVAKRLSDGAEYYAALPRFTLRQVISGAEQGPRALPGAWLAAARAAGETPASAIEAYHRLSARTTIAPIGADSLAADGLLALTEGARRPQIVAAARRTLEEMRSAIPADSTRRVFDYLFRPRGEWLADLHAAALLRAQLRLPGTSWAAAAPALAAIRFAPADAPTGADDGVVPAAAYRLFLIAARDTIGLRVLREEMRRAQPSSAMAVDALLDGYAQATEWYAGALRFFIDAPWIAREGRAVALGELVREFWGGAAVPAPRVGVRLFGYPQAVPRFGVPRPLFDRLIVPENWAARQWLERHGHTSLLARLPRLAPPQARDATVEFGDEVLRVASVPLLASESINGFLEPMDAIVLDPSLAPLLALGTLVHEWQHIAFERRRWSAAEPGRPASVSASGAVVTLRATDAYLGEGVAEWSAEAILAPLAERWPLLALGESAKRARMARAAPDDPHLLGYLMLRTLARAVPDRARLLAILADGSTAPARVAAAPDPARAWARYRGEPDRRLSPAGRRALVPETRFTLEDGYPDVVSTRIRIPR